MGKDYPGGTMPPETTITIKQQESLADLIGKLPYGYVSRYEWADLNCDLAKRDGQLDACGTLMSIDRKKIELLKLALQACATEFGKHNLPAVARAELT